MDHTFELDHPVWHALTGPHAHLALARGAARRYRPTVTFFAALAPEASSSDWEDLAVLAGEDELVLFGTPREVAAGFEELARFDVVQMTVPPEFALRDPGAVRLGADDAEEMMALVAETRPGPFLPETYLCGNYYGFREEGRLVAMAGERLSTEHWTEMSAVCTRDSHRGRGLATRLMRTVAAGIVEEGRTPFLHTGASNATALRLYAHLGFTRRACDNVVQRVRVAG